MHFTQLDGKGSLRFIANESGEIIQMISGQGYHSIFEKLPWYGSQSFQIILLGVSAIIILSQNVSALVVGPLRWAVRKLRKKEGKAVSKIAAAAWIWGSLASGMLIMFVVRSIGVLYAYDSIGGMPNFVWGVNQEMISALNAIYLPVLLSLPLPVFAGVAWKNGWWKTGTRIHFTLLNLAILILIWWANYWNLLGFRM